MMKKMNIKQLIALTALFCVVALTSCNKDIEGPVLPEPVSTPVATAVALDANQLFGIWGATKQGGTANGTSFNQTYRVEFQSVDDGEAVLSHWFTNGSSETSDSLC